MDEFYRVPLSSSEAKATLAALRVVESLLIRSEVVADIEPEILASACERMEAEVPEFVSEQAVQIAKMLLSDFADTLRDTGSKEVHHADEPPFPIGRTQRLLQDACARDVPVEIEYYVKSRKEWTTREVNCMSLSEQNGTLFLQGECGLRGDYRHFRLDHIRSVRVLDDDPENLPDPFSDE